MEEIKVINEQVVLGKNFRVYGDIKNPLFLAKDVADWIDYSKNPNGSRQTSKMVKSIDEDEKLVVKLLLPGDNQIRQHIMLTENGVYEVLMLSTLPIAKEFKKEVKKILKQMRLTGGVVVENREEEFINNYFPSFSEDVKLAMVQDLRKQNQLQKQIIEQQQPYVQLAMKRLDKNGLISITDANKTFELKRGQLTKWAKQSGYLHKTITEVNKKGEEYFRVYDNGGFKCIGVTQKGLEFINESLQEVKDN